MMMFRTYPSLHCTAHEDEVPGPCQGWRIAGTVLFSWMYACLRQKNIRTKEKHRNFKRLFKRAWHSFALSMFCIFDANSLRLLLLIWTKVFCNVTTIAPMPSFLARTRNLMMIVCKCSRWHCAIMDMRSLVLARDDVSRALFFWGCKHDLDRRTKEQKVALKNRTPVQASLTFVCHFNVWHLRWCHSLRPLLLGRTEEARGNF